MYACMYAFMNKGKVIKYVFVDKFWMEKSSKLSGLFYYRLYVSSSL